MRVTFFSLALGLIGISAACAQSYQSVYSFPTAASPGRDLVNGPDGLLYGCSDASPGTLYRLNPATSMVATLATMTGSTGVSPRGALCFASDGRAYGVAAAGGSANDGTIFRFDVATNTVTAIFHFSGLNGAVPEGGLVEGPEGWLYGVTRQGGNSETSNDPGKGTVFQFKPGTGEFKTIHHFNGVNGAEPRAALCKASDGKLYGTFSSGGPTSPAFGGVFIVQPTRTTAPVQTASILGTYYFRNSVGLAPTGGTPRGRLQEASTGTLYGTCSIGGANGQGSIFSFGMGSKAITLLASFKGYANANLPYTGASPLAGVTLGPDGSLYGTCSSGGSSTVNTGTIFRYTPSTRALVRVHDFNLSADFTQPRVAFALAADSSLYATADHGIYRLLLGGRIPVVGAPVASLVTSTGAKLSSVITPGGLVTRWWYEYGLGNNALTQRTQEQVLWNGVGTFTAAVNLGGLLPHTTYHFRLVTSNPQGTTYGPTKTFTTPNTPPKASPDHFGVGSSPVLHPVLANDTDADNDVLSITAVTQGRHGAVTIESNQVRYTPRSPYPPRDTFTYTLTDRFGGTARATVSTHEIYNPSPDDKYVQWAKSKWGTDTALNPILKDTIWGEAADPERDGLKNLIEYTFNLNPLVNDKSLFPVATIIKPTLLTRGSITYRVTQRVDDPALAVIPQVSYDAINWNPRTPANSLAWTGDGIWFYKGSLDPAIANGYQQLIYGHSFTAANAYARLTVLRNTATVSAGSPFDALNFPESVAPGAGMSAESVPVNLNGFHGSVPVSTTGGVRLIVNGVDVGTSANILAGSSLRLRAPTSGSGIYTIVIGGVNKTWNVSPGSIAPVTPVSGTVSGYTPVQAGVSPNGASQISVPIVTSPGVGGIEPKLSISYGSQGGNGQLGIGFNLNGLSAISRTPRNQAIDGAKGGINFDINDRFALDGQRLIRISGTEGGEGTEYRTETMDSGNFSRIVCYGATASGPTRWKVWTKAGLIMEYGATANGRMSAEGTTAVLVWALSSVTDTMNNLMTFAYDDTARVRGEVMLNYINYGQNTGSGLPVSQDVIFGYTTRPDPNVSYVAGYAVRALSRLQYIESRSRVNGVYSRVRRYDLTYVQGEITNHSRLTQVEETMPDGSQFPPTSFTWDDQTPTGLDNGVTVTTNAAALGLGWTAQYAPFSSNPPARVVQGDFNGDGIMDVIHMSDHPAAFTPYSQYVALGKRGGGFTCTSSITGLETKYMVSSDDSRLRTGDFNGDGKTDLLHILNTGAANWLATSKGDGSFTQLAAAQMGDLGSLTMHPGLDSELLVLDINGDGRSDVVYLQTGLNKVYLSNGNGSFTRVTTSGLEALSIEDRNAYAGWGWIIPGDYNGDGLVDIAYVYRQPDSGKDTWIAFSKGDGTFTTRAKASIPGAAAMTFENDSQLISGDYNGDGLTDIFCAKRNRSGNVNWIALCKGDGSFSVNSLTGNMANPSISGWDASKILAVDLNGDGFDDLYHIDSINQDSPVYSWMAMSNGNGAFGYIPYTSLGPIIGVRSDRSDYTRVFAGDFDGDGSVDIFQLNRFNYHSVFSFNKFEKGRVKQVSNGHGGYTRFEYKPLTDPAVYIKGTTATYPCVDLVAPMHVVSDMYSRDGADGDPYAASSSPVTSESQINYQYRQAVTCTDGRGFRGFGTVITTDMTRGVQTAAYNNVDDPILAGRPTSTWTITTSGKAIAHSITTWEATPTLQSSGLTTYFIYSKYQWDYEYEITAQGSNNQPIKTTTTFGHMFDDYGNVTHMIVDHGGGFREETTSDYYNTVTSTKWWLGRMTETTVSQTSAAGTASRRSTFTYSSANGLLKNETLATSLSNLELRKDYQHDEVGNIDVSTLTDATTGDTRRTITRYSADKRFILETENDYGHIETKTYDPLTGLVLTQTGPNGLTTMFEYDAFGRPVTELRSDGTRSITQYLRCTPGVNGAPARAVHCVRSQSSGSGEKTAYFDVLDRQIRTDSKHFSGNTVSAHQVYNSKGEVSEASDPYFGQNTGMSGARKTLFEYDEISRKKKTTAPGSRVTTSIYDGLTSTVTNPLGQSFRAVSDVRGRTTSATSFNNATVTNTFDPYGNLLQVNDGNGNTTTMKYDARGQKVEMMEPNSGKTTYTYNAFGEIKTQTDARGITISMSYDKLGRLIKRSEPEGDTFWEYDTGTQAKGKPVRVTMPSQDYEELYRYDAQGRPVETVYRIGNSRFVTGTSYDQYGRPLVVTYPTGFAIRNEYNINGYLSRVVDIADSSKVYWSAVSYNESGQTTQETFGNGLSTWRSYVPETGVIANILTGKTQNNVIQSIQYQFNSIGNLTQRTSGSVEEAFSYDLRNQLTSIAASISGQSQPTLTIQYDALGNITNRNDIGTYSYASGAGPHAVTSISGSTTGQNRTLKYDLAGNCILNGSTSITYTSNNQPSRISKGSTTLQFSYGPGRARYRQTESTATAYNAKLYIGGLYEREETGTGTITHTHYIPGGSGVIAIKTLTQTSVGTTEKLRYLHKDHLDSPHIISDETGALAETQHFDAWGRRRVILRDSKTNKYSFANLSETHSTDRGFTGHEMLDSVGLIHMNGRLYDPILGRFMSVDPIVQEAGNVLNLNRYSYVLNNPLSLTDPSGLFFKKLFKSIGKFFKDNWKTIATVVAGVMTAGIGSFIAGAVGASTFWGGVIVGASGGFGSAFSGTLLAGGSIGDALRAGLKGGIEGAIVGGALQGVDRAFPDWLSEKVVPDIKTKQWFTAERVIGQMKRMASRAFIRGSSNYLSGGSFGRGAAWSVVPDAAKWGLEYISESDIRGTYEKNAGMFGDNPNAEFQRRIYGHYFRPAQPDGYQETSNISMRTAAFTQTGAQYTGGDSNALFKYVTGESSPGMRVAEVLLGGSAQGISHDGFVASFGIPNPFSGTLIPYGEIPIVNELSNIPYAIPNYAALAATLPNPAIISRTHMRP